MKYYYLAFIIWISKILLWISIIGIPIDLYLTNNTNWFDEPFKEAGVRVFIKKYGGKE